MHLEIYLDESGVHSTTGVIVVAGYAGTREQWRQFETEWTAVLAEANIPYFHANENRCDRLREPLAACIRNSGVDGIAVVANKATYAAVASDATKGVLGNAYAFCAISCALNFRALVGDDSATAEFVVEDGQPNSEHVKRTIDEMFLSQPRYGVTSVAFAKKIDCVPFQAADLIAHIFGTSGHDLFLHNKRPAPNLRGLQMVKPELIQVFNEYWASAFGKRRSNKRDSKRARRSMVVVKKLMAEHKAKTGEDLMIIDGTLKFKYPNAEWYLIVQAKNGDLITVPDTPDGWRDFNEINEGKWTRLL